MKTVKQKMLYCTIHKTDEIESSDNTMLGLVTNCLERSILQALLIFVLK